MAQRKVFDSDDEEFECLGSDKGKPKEDSDASSSEDEKLLVESDSEDDAPDDVEFKVSKQTTLDKVKSALKQIESEKRQLKAKRKQKDDLYKEQKRKKLQELEKQRLPDEFLEELGSQMNKKQTKETNESQKQNVEDRLQPSDDEAESSTSETEDFIAFDNSIKPVYIKDVSEGPQSSAQKAEDFRNQALFGSKVRREPMNEKLAKKAKRKARYV